jgi:hypothetical protein
MKTMWSAFLGMCESKLLWELLVLLSKFIWSFLYLCLRSAAWIRGHFLFDGVEVGNIWSFACSVSRCVHCLASVASVICQSFELKLVKLLWPVPCSIFTVL